MPPLTSLGRRIGLRRSYGLLVVALLLLVYVQPLLAGEGPLADLVADLLPVVVLFACLSAVLERRRVVVFLAALLVVSQGARFAGRRLGLSADAAAVLHLGSTMLLCLLTMQVVLREVLRTARVDADKILGAVAVYLLLAMTFGLAFELAYHFQPSSLAMSDDVRSSLSERHGAISTFWYFSMITLTTVGYGDITPASALTRALSTLEAAIGQLFLATIVARLVALQMTQGGGPPTPPPPPPVP